MINVDPLNDDNLGLLPGSGPEIAYSRKFVSTVWNASWRFMASDQSYFELKYAGFHGHDKTDPLSPNTAAILAHVGQSGLWLFGNGQRLPSQPQSDQRLLDPIPGQFFGRLPRDQSGAGVREVVSDG